MNTPRGDDSPGLAGLLRYVAEVRDRRLQAIRQQAGDESRKLVRAARARAGEQVRQALREARQDAAMRVGLARAQGQARVRQAAHALTAGALQRIWPALGRAVRARWNDAEARREWLGQALALAQRHLPDGQWTLTHPAGWAAAEAEAALAALRERRRGVTVALEAGAQEEGFVVRCGPAELDLTPAALLRDRARAESGWLAELALERGGAAGRRTGT